MGYPLSGILLLTMRDRGFEYLIVLISMQTGLRILRVVWWICYVQSVRTKRPSSVHRIAVLNMMLYTFYSGVCNAGIARTSSSNA